MSVILKYFLSLFIIFNLNKIISSDDPNCFRAAVYEHVRIDEPIDNPLGILNNNLAIYEEVLRRSSYENVNIIVFPEQGLVPLFEEQTMLSNGLLAIAPDLNTNPCNEYKKKLQNITRNTFNQTLKNELLDELNQETAKQDDENVLSNISVLRKLSCLASKYKMYITVNFNELEVSDDQSTTTNPQTESDDQITTTENSQMTSTENQTDITEDQETTTENAEDKTDNLNEIDDKELATTQDQSESITESQQTTADNRQTTTDGQQTTTDSQQGTTEDQSTNKPASQNYLIFNTDFVFDNKGKLIAKCRKSNSEQAEVVTFENNWGKFGLCADLLFEHPVKDLVDKEKIDHLLFSTHWRDSYPNLQALNFHPSASIKYNINILSSNLRNLSIGGMGSGIYSKGNVRVQTKFNSNERLLIAELPVGKPDGKLEDYECKHTDKMTIEKEYKKFSHRLQKNTDINDYRAQHLPISEFKSILLARKQGKIDNFCSGDVCCNVEWKMGDRYESDHYYLIVSNKIRNSSDLNVSWYEETCSVVNYNKSKKQFNYKASTRFENLHLRGKFSTSEIFPNVLSSRLNSVSKSSWSFNQSQNIGFIALRKLRNPVNSVTLYARNFAKDPVPS